MNILYILGNGFDLAQGLQTSYSSFYQYLEKKSGSRLLQLLKKDIDANKKLWSDMEEAFGFFTEKIDIEEDDFSEFYFELSDHLQDYLQMEDNKISFSNDSKKKFISDFLNVEKYLGETDKIRYGTLVKPLSQDKRINVMTLNYTNTLENLLSISVPGSYIGKDFGANRYLQNIVHVHGKLGDAIIIGVDNEAQIANETFRKNEDIKDLLIKIQSNQAMKLLKHQTCEKFIKEANIIVIHGASLGVTDLRWWLLIGSELEKRKNLLLIQHLYEPNFTKPTRRQLLAQIERKRREVLLRKLGVQEENFEQFNERLFFTVNAGIF